jgi:hypothetical protein
MIRATLIALALVLSSCGATPGGRLADRAPKEAGGAATSARGHAAALAAGHEDLAAGDAEAAIADFDEALRARANDAAALAGRGYARLHVDDDEARRLARVDLEAALAATGVAKLQGAIHYNLGLLEDREGRGAEALAHYALAEKLRPSKVSKAAARGTRSCSVEIERDLREGGGPGRRARLVKTWRDAYAAVATEIADNLPPPPATDLEARGRLCEGAGPCSATAPSLVKLADDPTYPAVVEVGLVVPQADGRLLVVPGLASDMRVYHCAPEVRLSEERTPEAHRLTVDWLPQTIVGSGDDGRACTPDVDEGCMIGCMFERRMITDLFVDPATRRVLRIVRSAELGEAANDAIPAYLVVDLEPGEAGVTLRGCGTNERVAWP